MQGARGAEIWGSARCRSPDPHVLQVTPDAVNPGCMATASLSRCDLAVAVQVENREPPGAGRAGGPRHLHAPLTELAVQFADDEWFNTRMHGDRLAVKM